MHLDTKMSSPLNKQTLEMFGESLVYPLRNLLLKIYSDKPFMRRKIWKLFSRFYEHRSGPLFVYRLVCQGESGHMNEILTARFRMYKSKSSVIDFFFIVFYMKKYEISLFFCESRLKIRKESAENPKKVSGAQQSK